MPKLYEYFGLIIFFYSNEHEPIHVHGSWQDRENKAEIILQNGEIAEIRFGLVEGRLPLPQQKYRDFQAVVELKASEIVQRWIEYFVLHRRFRSEVIRRKIK